MFTGELDLRFRDKPIDGKWFIVTSPFKFFYKPLGDITVPAGVNTDFASIPRGLRWLIPRVGKHGKAAVLHDYLCEYVIVDRKIADKIFLVAMKELGVNVVKRRVMYSAVRAYSISIAKLKK